MKQTDIDRTVFQNMGEAESAPDLPASFRPVAMPDMGVPRNAIPYVAQQTSVAACPRGLNPLVSAASELLLAIVRIRATRRDTAPFRSGDAFGQFQSGEDIEQLRAELEAEIRAFERRALATADIEQAQLIAARYVLCTAVDEAVSTSLAGESGEWSRQGLLSTFHNETWGGEKFFQILDRCMQQPARNLSILELMYLLLSLGFEGKFGIRERGSIALESLRDKIYKQIRLLRGEPPQDLAPRVEPPKGRHRIHAYVPVWLVLAVFLFATGVTFVGFSTLLDKQAGPLIGDMRSVAGVHGEARP